jgi:3'-phosphoadenosine 5'-phosphosulfate sulfotransferase (PAPS reductase)/FAD synthetase
MTEPLRILSLGAGVQSSALLYMMIDGVIPKAKHAIFADTGWEPQKVYDHLQYLRGLMDQANIAFHQVSHGNIRHDAFAGQRFATMPFFVKSKNGTKGIVRRQCTHEYKIQPLLRKQRELVGLKPGQRSKQHLTTTVIGISWDELQRMKDPAFPWIRNEYPLVDRKITREDCIKYAQQNGYKIPPRSACIGCPFKSNDEWRRLRDEQPTEWQDAVTFDEALRNDDTRPKRLHGTLFLHKDTVPLEQADLRTNHEKGIYSLFDQECEGMCGL